MKITIQHLESALSKISSKKVDLKPDTDLRGYIKDSIDLGEVLAILEVEIDLAVFQNVSTAQEFLQVLNKK